MDTGTPSGNSSNSSDMSRLFIQSARLFVDLAVLSAAYWLAFLLRFEFRLELSNLKLLFFTWPYVVIFQYLVLVLFRVPAFSWRYVGVREAQRILVALAAATAVLVTLRLSMVHVGGYARYVIIPLGVLLMNFTIASLGVAGVRLLRRILAERQERGRTRGERGAPLRRTLLIGAGRAGVMVAREVAQNPQVGIDVVGFVDDDPLKVGTEIQGHKVIGGTADLASLAATHEAEQAVISIAAAPGAVIRRIVSACESIDLPVRIIPGIYEIIGGQISLSRIREVRIEDLLGRDSVELDLDLIGAFISGKRVLVTGAGGSIGAELCRQICRFDPASLVLLEQAENPLFDIHGELTRAGRQCGITPVIADICDSRRVEQVFAAQRPEVVFHAAAHKHVPMMEWNPGEALKNNVFGTRKVADAAARHGAAAFVMISTDKAVNPTSVMGATKRVAEQYVQALARRSSTVFVAVRFGNVLGSAGSVIPLFKEQIRGGGPVTVTHPEMRRYFMTIPEACQLVMQAAAMGKGGEIFVLDMGEPVRIVDLARDLIRLSGFTEEEIPIEFTGARPGEKLFEELGTSAEQLEKTRHPKVFIGRFEERGLDDVERGLETLARVTDNSAADEVKAALAGLVPELGDHR